MSLRLAFLLLLLLLQAADKGQELQTARRLGAAYYEEGNYKAAVEQFRRVLQAQPRAGAFADHLNLGLALMSLPDEAGALAELETARQMNPASPAPLYALGILHKRQGRFREALDYLQRAQKAGAGDIATVFNTGAVLMSLGRSEEALAHFQKVLDRGIDFGPGWYLAAQYRTSRLLQRMGRAEDAQRLLQRWEAQRKAARDPTDSAAMLELGPLAQPQNPAESAPARREVAVPVFSGPVRHTGGEFASAATHTVVFDYDVDGDLDRLTIPANCGALRLERNNGNDTYTDVTAAAGVVVPGGKKVCGAAVADFDNDSDPDIVAVGPDGAWLFSNLRGGKFSVSTPFGEAKGGMVAAADLDADGAFDAVFGSYHGDVQIWWNRGGQPTKLEGHKTPWAIGDLNGDGLMDVVAVRGDNLNRLQLIFWLNQGGRRFQPQLGASLPPEGIVALKTTYSPEGKFSVLARTEKGVVWQFDRTTPKAHWLRLALEGVRSNKAGVGAVVEVKAGNFYTRALVGAEPLTVETGALQRVDVVRVTWPNGIVQNVIETATDRVLRVAEQDRLASSCPLLYLWDGREFRFFAEVLSRTPLGEPDGRGGSILPGYREPVLLPAEKLRARGDRYMFQLTEELREAVYLDRARLVALDYPAGRDTRALVDEAYRGAPADVPPVVLAGVAPLALRREPAAPRHTASVLSRINFDNACHSVWGGRPRPRGTSTSRPGRTWRSGAVLEDCPTVIVNSWLGQDTSSHALPGLVEQHAIYFELPAGADFLALRGWTYWMDSNIATAASQDPSRAALPPRLEAQQADGAWKTLIADLGLPAGAGRWVLADLRPLWGRHSCLPGSSKRPRDFTKPDGQARMPIPLRIVTNLRVSWDEILAGKAAGAPRQSARRPLAADLHYRGFSAPMISPTRSAPDHYDYSHLLAEAPWDALPGRYTRYGDVLPLVGEEDDQLVVLAAGDELTLEFSAKDYPPLPPGWRRDFVLELSGWAKAGETNTATSENVEPLPFRGMKRYPYRAAATPAWQRRWLTRRPMPHLVPLAPAW